MINTVVFESPDMFTEFGGVSEFSVEKVSKLRNSAELSKHIWTLKDN